MAFPSRLLAVLCLAASSHLASAQATGRFLGGPSPELPGFTWSESGFRAADSNGSLFRFSDPASAVKLQSATSRSAEWEVVGGRHAPTHLRVNLRSPGFEMRVRPGFRFRLDSLRPPLFTTAIGTYEGAPAPASRWIMVSLREDTPPVLFAFRQGVSEMRAEGSAGQWEVRLSPGYEGWVRVILPFGQRPPTTSETLIERLGRQASAVKGLAPFITGPSPRAQSQRVLTGASAFRLDQAFDVPGAVLPSAPLLAALGTGVQVQTPYRLVSDSFAEGPLAVSTALSQSIRLPHGPLPLGRALTVGAWTERVPAEERRLLSVTPTNFRESQPKQALSLYAGLNRGYAPFSAVESYLPSNSEQVQKFADAALAQAWWINEGLLPDTSALALTALLWKMDPLTWTLSSGLQWQADIAKAALLSETPERRAEGLMLAYGLAAQKEAKARADRFGFAAPRSAPALTSDLRVMMGLEPPGRNWTRLLSAPFWLQRGPQAWLRKGDRTWVLLFMAASSQAVTMTFRSRTPVKFDPATNVASFKADRKGDVPGVWRWDLTIHPQSQGLVEVRLPTPDTAFVRVPSTVQEQRPSSQGGP